jgi:hypothetical protein
MEKKKKILSGIFAIIMEESMTSDVYKENEVTRYPLDSVDPTFEEPVVRYKTVQSNMGINNDLFVVTFYENLTENQNHLSFSEIRFGCYHNKYDNSREECSFNVAIKNDEKSDPTNYLSFSLSSDDYEKIKKVSEKSIKNPNEQISIRSYLDLLNSLNIEQIKNLNVLYGTKSNLKK